MANETPVKPQPNAIAPMWPDFEHFGNEMQRMMAAMFARPWSGLPEMMPALTKAHPALNLYQENGKLIAELAVPGIEKKDLKINVSDRMLTIEGEYKREQKTQKERSYICECSSGEFSRSVRLPAEVKSKEAQADLKDGMLRITMPLVDPQSHELTQIHVK